MPSRAVLVRCAAAYVVAAHLCACGEVKSTLDSDASTVDAAVADAAPPSGPLRFNDVAKNLGSLTIGEEGLPFSTKVRNTGDADIGPLDVEVAGDTAEFRVDASDCQGSTLASGGDCDVTVRFAPTTAGARAATVTISDATTRAVLELSGAGLTPGALVVEPASHDFTRHTIGTAATATFTVRNTGDVALPAFTAAGDGDGDFTVDASACPATLEGGARCDVVVTFAPVRGGARTSSLRARATGAEAASQLGGTGVGTVTITKSGDGAGDGTITGTGLACSGATCTVEVAEPTCALAAAGTATSSRFIGWSAPCSTGERCVVPVDAAQVALTATFRQLVTLTAVINGPAGAIEGLPATCEGGGGTRCTAIYVKDTAVPLTLRRIAAPGIPRGWIGCDMLNGVACTMIMTASKTVEGVFRP